MDEEKKEYTLNDVIDTLKELTTAQTDTIKELKKFREVYEKHQKAGKF